MTCRFKHFCGAYKEISVYCSYLSRFCGEHKVFEQEEIETRERVERLKQRTTYERLMRLAGRDKELFYEKGLDGINPDTQEKDGVGL